MNKVQLCGYLGQDFELRYGNVTGNAIATNSLAITKRYQDSNGIKKERVDINENLEPALDQEIYNDDFKGELE